MTQVSQHTFIESSDPPHIDSRSIICPQYVQDLDNQQWNVGCAGYVAAIDTVATTPRTDAVHMLRYGVSRQ
jgi:hypothetical protein